MLETDVSFKNEFDGSDWHVNLDDKVGGPGMNSETAGKVLWWLGNGGLQFILDVKVDLAEKAFREREMENGNL
jgi:hypothetical protein